MNNINSWDWDVGKKVIDISSWRESSIEELRVSHDGENLAAIVKNEDGFFRVYNTQKTWKDCQFERIWHLRFAENQMTYACVSIDDEWTVAIDGKAWNQRYEYVWNLLHTTSNGNLSVAAAVKKNMQYFMALDDESWSQKFPSMTYCTLSLDGKITAAVVQTEPHNSGEIDKFKKNIYTVAVNGKPWIEKFLNVWNISINHDAFSVAAEVRLNSREYTIAVDGLLWPKTYDCVWKPIFHPKKNVVIAPIRIGNRWGIAIDSFIAWRTKFYQVWHQKYDSQGINLAAIVSSKYGRWTVAVNEVPWKNFSDTMMSDLTFSHNGKRLSVLAKHKNFWSILVDDSVWKSKFDMAWPPVFSSNDENIAAMVEKKGKYTFIINGVLYNDTFDLGWNPKFNQTGDKLLLRTIKNNKYERRVIMINDIGKNL